MKIKNLILLFTLAFCAANAQQEIIRNDSLKELVITSSRIDLPFKENSRTIQIITASDIKNLGVTNVADALQQIAGVDVRRQGVQGAQADLYIRGGSFDQTLLLIDGIKVDDPQTGHHTLNLALPIDVIKRIEVIKGPAARIFGQNAFTGAINIVTKDGNNDSFSAKLQTGSFHTFLGEVVGTVAKGNSSHIIQVGKNISEGYRENTDVDNTSIFVKSQFNKKALPINFISSYNERKFGANGFYGFPSAKQQYEETQASLIGVSTEFKKGNFTWKPRLYWRRNQDEYVYIRSNPAAYRNLHITNKIAAELNGAYKSKLGTTGFGTEFSKYYINSNNLGENQREIASMFLEHRFEFFNAILDITPGISTSYFSDFDNQVFPGLDVGFKISDDIRAYANTGYTYRVPTYTDLYYIGPQAIGNANLQPEKAISYELGMKVQKQAVNFSAAGFYRNALQFIDYVRLTDIDPWRPEILDDVITKGFETQFTYQFTFLNQLQKLQLGYSYIDNKIKNDDVQFSQYGLNALKHQVTSSVQLQFLSNFSTTFSYRYAERTEGTSFNVYNANLNYTIKNVTLSLYANNIFNTEYTESGLLPMPKGNILFGLHYNFR